MAQKGFKVTREAAQEFGGRPGRTFGIHEVKRMRCSGREFHAAIDAIIQEGAMELDHYKKFHRDRPEGETTVLGSEKGAAFRIAERILIWMQAAGVRVEKAGEDNYTIIAKRDSNEVTVSENADFDTTKERFIELYFEYMNRVGRTKQAREPEREGARAAFRAILTETRRRIDLGPESTENTMEA